MGLEGCETRADHVQRSVSIFVFRAPSHGSGRAREDGQRVHGLGEYWDPANPVPKKMTAKTKTKAGLHTAKTRQAYTKIARRVCGLPLGPET